MYAVLAVGLCLVSGGYIVMRHPFTPAVQVTAEPSYTIPGLHSEVFGPVASGTIYTTLINMTELEPTLASSTPYAVELSATGTLRYAEQASTTYIDYQPLAPNLFSLGVFESYTPVTHGWYELRNAARQIIARLKIADNENTDVHGITYLKNGHVIIPSYKTHVDAKGNTIQSFLLEEQTQKGEVVFIWDSFDHVPLTESNFTEQREYWLTNHINDYFHENSVAEAIDGNLLISARHTNTIYKINHSTGAIMWRLGGEKSDFTFVDDPEQGFTHQHSIHQLSNGHILLYDNGNLHSPKVTRVAEYDIDEKNKTARLVWSYTDGRFTYATGSVQRLNNGDTLIGWGLEVTGLRSDVPRITEVNASGTVVMNIYFPDRSGLYNVFKAD
jgi:hypothetical protein